MDKEVRKILQKEKNRQLKNIELIASENFVSNEVLKLMGSVFTNKYAEGYPGKRYYGGCTNVDLVENLATQRLKELYDVKYANVQPHSGSSANMAAYRALLNPGDKIMGLDLTSGGHLTHGHKLNFSGKDYEIITYNVDPITNLLDYDAIEKIAKENNPKLIVAGFSAYPRSIDFARLRSIADKVNAYLMVDMAHIAGLVAAKVHVSPIPYAHIVTSTTHKTLRGPRGGIILTNDEEIINKVNKVIFPGIQGGPLMHIIAAKAVCFKEALEPKFINYQKNVIANARALADTLINNNLIVITGGTDNHLLLVDVKTSLNITGKVAEQVLDEIGITCNKNTIPFDSESPMVTSGIRLGSAAMTTRGFTKEDFIKTGNIIAKALKNYQNKNLLKELKKEVHNLTKNRPLFKED